MVSHFWILAVLAPAIDVGVPIALVASADKEATLQRGKAKLSPHEGDVLLPGDKLIAGPKGGPTLVLLADGRRLRLKPSKEVSLGAKGLEPADAAAEELAGPTPDAALLKTLREAYRGKAGIKGAVTVLRGGAAAGAEAARASGTMPLFGALVLTDHPTLSWAATTGAKDYRVTLLSGVEGPDKVIWTATTTETHLPYPEGEKVLSPGLRYRWRVAARMGEDKEITVAEGKFFIATVREAERLAGAQRLAASDDPTSWLLAADAYDAAAVYGLALPLYEKLAARAPEAPNYQLALAAYYTRAGRVAEANRALERAKKLGAAIDEE